MTAETAILREEIEQFRRELNRDGRTPLPLQIRALLDMAEAHLDEPARLAAARDAGVREGIEMAAQNLDERARHSNVAGSYHYRCIAATIRSLAPAPAWTPTHRHYKGALYRVVYDNAIWAKNGRMNGAPLVVYVNEAGQPFVLPPEDWQSKAVVSTTETDHEGNHIEREVPRYDPIAPTPAEAPTTPTVEASGMSAAQVTAILGDPLGCVELAPAEASAPVADYMIACGQHADARRVAEEQVAALEAENEKLRRELAEFAVHEEFDFPGDSPVSCGLHCQICGETVEADGSGHADTCLLSARALLQGQGGADATGQ